MKVSEHEQEPEDGEDEEENKVGEEEDGEEEKKEEENEDEVDEEEEEWAIPEKMEGVEESEGGEVKEITVGEAKIKGPKYESKGTKGTETEELEEEEEWGLPERVEGGAKAIDVSEKEIAIEEVKSENLTYDDKGTNETSVERLEEEEEWPIPGKMDGGVEPMDSGVESVNGNTESMGGEAEPIKGGAMPLDGGKKVEVLDVSPETDDVVEHKTAEENSLDEIMNLLNDFADEDEGQAE